MSMNALMSMNNGGIINTTVKITIIVVMLVMKIIIIIIENFAMHSHAYDSYNYTSTKGPYRTSARAEIEFNEEIRKVKGKILFKQVASKRQSKRKLYLLLHCNEICCRHQFTTFFKVDVRTP